MGLLFFSFKPLVHKLTLALYWEIKWLSNEKNKSSQIQKSCKTVAHQAVMQRIHWNIFWPVDSNLRKRPVFTFTGVSYWCLTGQLTCRFWLKHNQQLPFKSNLSLLVPDCIKGVLRQNGPKNRHPQDLFNMKTSNFNTEAQSEKKRNI